MFLPGSISGADLILAESLRLATIEPVKVTAPMKMPIETSASWMLRRLASESWLPSMWPLMPMATAARPTKECSRAISSGMPVISTMRARQMPMAPPTTTAPTSRAMTSPRSSRPSLVSTVLAIVATSASAIPTMP